MTAAFFSDEELEELEQQDDRAKDRSFLVQDKGSFVYDQEWNLIKPVPGGKNDNADRS